MLTRVIDIAILSVGPSVCLSRSDIILWNIIINHHTFISMA